MTISLFLDRTTVVANYRNDATWDYFQAVMLSLLQSAAGKLQNRLRSCKCVAKMAKKVRCGY